MLSTAKHYEEVPMSPRYNLGWRNRIYALCKDNPEYQRGIIEMCSQDCLFYLSTFVWQYNPDHPTRRVAPFVPWKRQQECIRKILDKIDQRKDLIIEKSRYQGATLIVVSVFDWLQRFHPWTKTHMISRKQELVDSVSDDSLFWKLDFIEEWLPDWLKMRPNRQSMYRENTKNRAIITGESTTGKAGVGGRATIMLMDEFAQIREDFEVLHRTTETTHCRIFVSTHLGQDTAFYTLCQSEAIEKFVLHWSDHPEQARGLYVYENGKIDVLDKTYSFPDDYRFVTDGKPTGGPKPGVRSPYYDNQCERKGSSRAVAMDLDIDPQGSMSQFFDPLIINSLRRHFACPPYLEGDLLYDEGGYPLGFEERRGGLVKLWCNLDSQGNPIVDVYGAGADISTGEGASPSCLSFGLAATGDKVCEVATSRHRPVDFACLSVALCRWFHNAILAWEQAGPGYTFGKRIMELAYGKVYYKKDDLAYGLLHNHSWAANTDKPGWYPSPSAKRLLLDNYAKALTKKQYLNRSDQALKETLSFKYNDAGNPEHAAEKAEDPSQGTVNHGDRVIADALCSMMLSFIHRPKKQEEKKQGPAVLSLQWRRDFHNNKEREEEEA